MRGGHPICACYDFPGMEHTLPQTGRHKTGRGFGRAARNLLRPDHMRSSSLIACVGMLLAFTALSSADIFSLPIAGTVKVGRTVSLSGLYTAESGDVAAAENFWLSWANNQVRLAHR